MKYNSIRFKASILYTTVLFFILSTYSAVLFYAIKHILYNEVDNVLRVKSQAIVDIINTYSKVSEDKKLMFIEVGKNVIYFNKKLKTEAERRTIENLWLSRTQELSLKSDYICFLTANSDPVLYSSNFDEKMKGLFKSKAEIPFSKKNTYSNIHYNGVEVRVITCLFEFHNKSQYIVQVGTSLDAVNNVLSTLSGFIGISVLLILILTSFVGSFFARQILNPVMAITKIANNISQKDLHVRIAEKAVDGEMKYLVDSLNNMIRRLEVSFENINEFSSHVAHELKTHLTVIKGEMDLALMKSRDKEEYERVLALASAEMNRVIKIINDLLLLARLDNNISLLKREKFDIPHFLREICEQGEIIASEKKIKLLSDIPDTEAMVSGDKVHLRRIFFNLISNAVKFTADGGEIKVTLEKDNDKYKVTVSDTGEGIAPGNLKKIFNKFFRIETEGGPEGNGLGLSIALSIAKAHGGDILVESVLGKGSRFTVILPAA